MDTMNSISKKLLGTLSLVSLALAASLATGCAAAASEDTEATDEVEQGKIIGQNDLTPVTKNGANIPAKYAPIINAFGVMSMGCTATHIGGGIVLSAGHCFGAPSTRKDNVPCPNVTVKWGVRRDSAAFMTSQCKIILAEEHSRDRDYSIYKVEPAPEVAIAPDLGKRPTVDTEITIFGHPQRRPLEWSKTCPLKLSSAGGWGKDQFSHQCDTEPGSSGSTILADGSLKVIGIHDGGNSSWNYGTYLADTPIAEFVTPPGQPDEVVPEPTEPTTEE